MFVFLTAHCVVKILSKDSKKMSFLCDKKYAANFYAP